MNSLPNPFDPEPTTSTGGCQEAPAVTSTVTVAAGAVGAFDSRFVLDVPAFMQAIERPEYLAN